MRSFFLALILAFSLCIPFAFSGPIGGGPISGPSIYEVLSQRTYTDSSDILGGTTIYGDAGRFKLLFSGTSDFQLFLPAGNTPYPLTTVDVTLYGTGSLKVYPLYTTDKINNQTAGTYYELPSSGSGVSRTQTVTFKAVQVGVWVVEGISSSDATDTKTITDGRTVLTRDDAKILFLNSTTGGGVTVEYFDLGAQDIGETWDIFKVGAGPVWVQLTNGESIGPSGASTYCLSTDVEGHVKLKCISAVSLQFEGFPVGTWTVTD